MPCRIPTKKRGLTAKRQAWVEILEEKPNLRQALACLAPRGLATQDQVEQLSGLSNKQARVALDDLLKGFYGNAALLRSESVHLQGRRGRPQVVYLLTADGAAVLNHLLPEESISAAQIEDPVELAHALMEMEVYVRAKQAGLTASVEHVLRFDESHSIRADVLIQTQEQEQVIFEMEQAARPGDVARILSKLKQYVQFFRSEAGQQIASNVRILFNLAPNDTMTVKRWELVLGELRDQEDALPFRLFWQPVLDFLASPQWNSLDTFTEIVPEHEVVSAPTEDSDSPEDCRHPDLFGRPAHAKYGAAAALAAEFPDGGPTHPEYDPARLSSAEHGKPAPPDLSRSRPGRILRADAHYLPGVPLSGWAGAQGGGAAGHVAGAAVSLFEYAPKPGPAASGAAQPGRSAQEPEPRHQPVSGCLLAHVLDLPAPSRLRSRRSLADLRARAGAEQRQNRKSWWKSKWQMRS